MHPVVTGSPIEQCVHGRRQRTFTGAFHGTAQHVHLWLRCQHADSSVKLRALLLVEPVRQSSHPVSTLPSHLVSGPNACMPATEACMASVPLRHVWSSMRRFLKAGFLHHAEGVACAARAAVHAQHRGSQQRIYSRQTQDIYP